MADHPALSAAIFDVDGVLLDSPHEQAWREALDELMAGPWEQLALATDYQAGSLTTARYQHGVAGRPRLDGAREGLHAVGVADPDEEQVRAYAETKQKRLVDLIEREPPAVFQDAVALLVGLRDSGLAIATASASRNAHELLAKVTLRDGRSLRDLLNTDVSGLDAPGKPNPMIFLEAARRLGLPPHSCLVIEDAPAGIAAARRAGMASVGVARSCDADELRTEGADLVLDRLDRLKPTEILNQLRGRS